MKLKGFLVILWMIIIFCFSNQPATQSSKLSDGFINRTVVRVYEIFNGKIDNEKQQEIISKYSYPIRKMAHFTLYFILGFLVFIYLNGCTQNKFIIIYSLLICFIYACTDEFHQYFVNGRYCSFIDVLIDSAGALTSILLTMFTLRVKKHN